MAGSSFHRRGPISLISQPCFFLGSVLPLYTAMFVIVGIVEVFGFVFHYRFSFKPWIWICRLIFNLTISLPGICVPNLGSTMTRDCLTRQVRENVLIRRSQVPVLNSKTEWHQPALYRIQLEVERG